MTISGCLWALDWKSVLQNCATSMSLEPLFLISTFYLL